MATDIYFRSAFSGYNKNDVISFIERMNSEQIERVNDLNDRIRTAQTEAKKYSAELAELKNKCTQLEAELAKRDQIRSDNDEKAQKYDAMQDSYADIMLEAERTSKEKVKTAEEKAQQILFAANETKKKIVAENKQIIENSKSELISLINKLTDSLDRTLLENALGEDNE